MATAGPLNPATASGTLWTNAAGIESNSTFATRNASSGVDFPTAELIGTNFGFSIPAGATINGISVTFAVKKTAVTGSVVTVTDVNIYKGGSSVGGKAPGTTVTTSLVDQTQGGSSDLWSNSWTLSDINGSGFGFSIQLDVDNTGGGSTVTASVQNYRVTVTYTVSSGITLCQTSTFGF